jgi:hypothetical protein
VDNCEDEVRPCIFIIWLYERQGIYVGYYKTNDILILLKILVVATYLNEVCILYTITYGYFFT